MKSKRAAPVSAVKKVFHFDSQADGVSRGRVRRLALRAGDAQIPQEARNLVGRPTEDRRRGESLRLPGGGVRAQLRLGTGANLDAAARDEPGDPDGPQRLWSIRRLAGLWRE